MVIGIYDCMLVVVIPMFHHCRYQKQTPNPFHGWEWGVWGLRELKISLTISPWWSSPLFHYIIREAHGQCISGHPRSSLWAPNWLRLPAMRLFYSGIHLDCLLLLVGWGGPIQRQIVRARKTIISNTSQKCLPINIQWLIYWKPSINWRQINCAEKYTQSFE